MHSLQPKVELNNEESHTHVPFESQFPFPWHVVSLEQSKKIINAKINTQPEMPYTNKWDDYNNRLHKRHNWKNC